MCCATLSKSLPFSGPWFFHSKWQGSLNSSKSFSSFNSRDCYSIKGKPNRTSSGKLTKDQHWMSKSLPLEHLLCALNVLGSSKLSVFNNWLPRAKALICSVCQFLWCKYSHHGGFQPTTWCSWRQSWRKVHISRSPKLACLLPTDCSIPLSMVCVESS
jgi:hypothetical protein